MNILPASLAALAVRKQFVLYKLVPSTDRPGKTDKKPCDQYGREIKWSDPSCWLTADEAVALSQQCGYEIGFIFTEADDQFFIDIDNCLQPDNTWSQLALEVMQAFAGAAMEVSSSGRGIHIIARGKAPIHRCKSRDFPNLEFYTRSRFVALTGNSAMGDAGIDFSVTLLGFIEKYFTDSGQHGIGDLWIQWSTALEQPPHTSCTPIESDIELIAKACGRTSAESAFGDKASFSDLWNNNEEKLQLNYINATSGDYDRSAADAALIQMLCFWTGNDAPRIERLMRDSGLYRDKFDRADYLPRSVLKARGWQTTFYNKDFLKGKPVAFGTTCPNTTTASESCQAPPPLPPLPLQKINYVEHTETGKPANSVNNLKQLLRHYGITVRWNDMAHQREVNIPNETVHIGDAENASLCKIIDLCSLNNLPVTRIDEQLNVIGQEDTYHPIAECIASKPWDGVPRLDQFIGSLKTKNNAEAYPLVRTWMLATAASAFAERGFTHQGILVLEGPQGLEKTRWVKNLDPTQSTAVKEGMLLDLTSKDCIITAISHWIVEIGELDGTIRRTDMARLKSFSTSQVDVVRFPYARKNTRVYRRTGFIASVNEPRFLTDTTGNRRWWVVSIEAIDNDHGLDMQQVWAEVYHYYLAGEKTYLDKKQVRDLNLANARYEMVDPFEESLLSYFDWVDDWRKGNKQELTSTEVLKLLGYPQNGGKQDPTRMANILKRHTELSSTNTGRRTYWLPMPKVKK